MDALGERRERCVILGANSVAESAGSFRCDSVYLVPPVAAADQYTERIAGIVREERPHLVVPTRDDDVLALSLLAEQLPLSDTVLLTGNVRAAQVMCDKAETARFAVKHHLPFAQTAMTGREALELARSHGLPLIAKPRRGSATRGVVLLRSPDEIECAFASQPELIAQAFLDPPDDMAALSSDFNAGLPLFFSFPEIARYVVHLIVGPDGTLSESFGTLSVQVGGRATQSRRFDDPGLLEIGCDYGRAAAAEGWKGPLNVQLKRGASGGFTAHELAGRFNGGTAGRALMGFDEISIVARLFLPGIAFPPNPVMPCDAVQNMLTSQALERAGVAALRSDGIWHARV
jgi:carbamoyl-phosphate synthase large subunit